MDGSIDGLFSCRAESLLRNSMFTSLNAASHVGHKTQGEFAGPEKARN